MDSKEKDRKKKVKISKLLIIPVIGVIFTGLLFQINIVKSLEHKVYDSLFYFREPLEDKSRNVVIVAIDEASIQSVGNWPWPRSRLAELIARIKEGNPAVIGIDLLLDIPTYGKEGQSEDDSLASVFSGPPVSVIPVVLNEDDPGLEQELIFKPLEIFLTDYTRMGVANVFHDPVDKITREFQPLYGNKRLSFPLAVCLEYMGLDSNDTERQGSYVVLGDYRIPVYGSRALINYRGAKTEEFSASDVMEPFFNPSFFFEGKIVLLGRTDLASKDFVNTPLPSGKIFEASPMAGVQVWKEVIDMILTRNFLYRLPAVCVFLVMLVLSFIVGGLTSFSNKTGVLSLVAVILLSVIVFYGSFLVRNLVIPLLQVISACTFTCFLFFLYNYVVYYRERNMMAAAFKSYLSPGIMEDILSKKVDLKVGGTRRKLTVLFADIRGFTDFADSQEPEEVLNLLKIFFSEMNRIIISHNGIIDKLMGDGILAFFGNFTDTDEHALEAVRAALEMQARVPGLRERLGFDLELRIGINTGYVTVGNIGSDEHLDYTVIGKNVNMAQRLESSCDPGKILVSESTHQLVKEAVQVEGFREVPLKGFAREVKVCTVVSLK